MIWTIGAIIAFIISVAVSTIYVLQHHKDQYFSLSSDIFASLLLTALASILSWFTVGAAITIFITHKVYTKYQKGKQNEKQN